MRLLAFAAFAALATPVFGACGGADPSDLQGGPTGNPNPNDGGPINADGSSGQDAGPGCDQKCAINVPQGFRLVTYAADRSKDCLAGWRTTDVVSDPVVSDPSACSCACNVGTPPTCTNGTINRFLGFSSSTCSSPATTLMATGGCDPISGGISLQGNDYSATPPAATGGACTFDTKTDPSKLTATPARVCEPPASCLGAVCGVNANVCVAQDGDVACPVDYPTKKVVGASPNVDCAACGACTVSADCTGKLSLFTDMGCSTGEQDFAVDGTCNPVTLDGSYYIAFKYAGSLKGSPSCGALPPPPMATPKLDKPTTICCKK